MSKFTLFLSLGIILFIHFTVLTFTYEKEKPVILKPKYQKFSVQLAKVKRPPKPVEKPIIEKKIEEIIKPKPVVEKKVFKKPIKKDAKREFVKKKVVKKKRIAKKKAKKIVKKKPLKKPVKKKEKKELPKLVEKPTVKVLEKVVKPVKEIKEVAVSSKAAAQSLEKFKKAKNTYLVQLRAAIDRNKKYPTASKRLEEEGIVTVKFKILKSGLIQNIVLFKSSGKRRLDKAAIKAVSKTYKFKAFPKDINKAFMPITVPIKFRLNN